MKVGIYGYGNLGRGVELALAQAPDMDTFAVFTRRDPQTVKTATGVQVLSADDVEKYKADLDVLIICGGSATDLPEMTPRLVQNFNVVDSFDTHANIPDHFARVDAVARENRRIALISGGWDPGMFSLARVYGSAILPDGRDYTFWGRGVSQGHSDAIRRIDGVLDARQYTVPVEAALAVIRSGETPELTPRQKHLRECYVAVREDADRAKIEEQIKTMPNYFADYDTTVHFISLEELKRNHGELPHGGTVIRSGKTGATGEHSHTVEYRLALDSNPEFTGSVLVALARAIGRMARRGEVGCKTVFDLAPADLSPLSPEELRRRFL